MAEEAPSNYSLSSLLEIPIRIILASTLIIVDLCSFSNKSKEITQIIKNIRETQIAD